MKVERCPGMKLARCPEHDTVHPVGESCSECFRERRMTDEDLAHIRKCDERFHGTEFSGHGKVAWQRRALLAEVDRLRVANRKLVEACKLARSAVASYAPHRYELLDALRAVTEGGTQ